ncbi:MAG TPA: AI-2E family transporter [Bacteroidia bacterium]|nr:AI-2E family transporter [Bacteroidia bacterium]
MGDLPGSNSFSEKKIIDIALKLVLIFFLVGWCAMILLPFVTILLWSIILAITLFPLFDKLANLLNGKRVFSAVVISLFMLLILLVPIILLLASISEEAKLIAEAFRNDTLRVPLPNPKVAEWPLVGPKLYQAWSSMNLNLENTLIEHKDQLRTIGEKTLHSLMSVVSNTLMFAAAIIIAGVFMGVSQKAHTSTLHLFERLSGNKGEELMKVVIQTIRNVAKGIIGVAFVQFAIMGIVFVMADVPFAGIWALLVLILALVQLPATIVAVPVIIYIFSVKETVPAIIWTILILLAGLSDNILKPYLMGKGAPVPMLVIFLGSIGGFVLSGFIGLFTGAIILSLGYKLAGLWLEGEKPIEKEDL